jgi:hypothetical protein
MKESNKKTFVAHKKSGKVRGVGYRGKMFYLSDLLLHVIGFG